MLVICWAAALLMVLQPAAAQYPAAVQGQALTYGNADPNTPVNGLVRSGICLLSLLFARSSIALNLCCAAARVATRRSTAASGPTGTLWRSAPATRWRRAWSP